MSLYAFISVYCAHCGDQKPCRLWVYCSLRCERAAFRLARHEQGYSMHCMMEHVVSIGGDTVRCSNAAAYYDSRLEMWYCPVCHRHGVEEELEDVVAAKRIAKGTIATCEHCRWADERRKGVSSHRGA